MVPTRSLADVQMSGIKYLHLKEAGGFEGKKGKDKSTHLVNPLLNDVAEGRRRAGRRFARELALLISVVPPKCRRLLRGTVQNKCI